MAIHANSTNAPARPLLPLRGPDGRFARHPAAAAQAEPAAAPSPPLLPADAPSADEVLDDMARELDRQGVPRGPSPLPSLSDALARRRALFGAVEAEDTPEEIGLSTSADSGLDVDVAPEEITPAPLPPLGAALSRRRAIFGAVTLAEPEHATPLARPAPDPAFAAVQAFDRAVAEWDAAFGEYLGIMDALDPAGALCWDDPPAVARAVLGPVAGSTVAELDRLSRRMEALDLRHEAAEARLLSTRPASEIGAAALRAAVRRYARRPFGSRGEEAVMLARLAA